MLEEYRILEELASDAMLEEYRILELAADTMSEEYRILEELAADTMLREYRFHNSYQYEERQMLNGKCLQKKIIHNQQFL